MRLWTVILISYVVCTLDDCEGIRRPIQCYHCSTENNQPYCADPFNVTSRVKTITCMTACAKWVKKPRKGEDADGHQIWGELQYIRTCSERLNMHMPVSYVCMKESRPGDGHLCFCRKSLCNGASGTHDGYVIPLVLVGLLSLLWTHCRWRHTLFDYLDLSEVEGNGDKECDTNRDSNAVTYDGLHKSDQDRLHNINYKNFPETTQHIVSVGAG